MKARVIVQRTQVSTSLKSLIGTIVKKKNVKKCCGFQPVVLYWMIEYNAGTWKVIVTNWSTNSYLVRSGWWSFFNSSANGNAVDWLLMKACMKQCCQNNSVATMHNVTQVLPSTIVFRSQNWLFQNSCWSLFTIFAIMNTKLIIWLCMYYIWLINFSGLWDNITPFQG